MVCMRFAVLSVIILSFFEVLACPRVSPPKYGSFDDCRSDIGAGDYCSFKCDKGFRLLGHNRIRCLTDGSGVRWSEGPPTCDANRCPAAKVPKNGSVVKCEPRQWEGRCTIKCDKGFNLTGSAEIQCLDIGGSTQWSEQPRCIPPGCPKIDPPENGHFQRCDHSSPRIGDTCYIECDSHHKLSTKDNTISCLQRKSKDGVPEGYWNRPVPLCSGGVKCSHITAILLYFCLLLGLLN